MNSRFVNNSEEKKTISNRVKKILGSRSTRRNVIRTGLLGAGLYTFEKSIINPVRSLAAESNPTKNNKKFLLGLRPTIRPTQEGFKILNTNLIADEIKNIKNSRFNYKQGWLDAWQALARLTEANQTFVEDYRKNKNNPNYSVSGIQMKEMINFFNRAGEGQNPIGVILGCVDSRVHYERRLGLKDSQDIPNFFIERSIGNIINPYGDFSLAATLQYNLEGIKRDVVLLIQMVHQNCGMVAAAAEGKAFKLGGDLEAAGYLVKPAVEPGSPWKGFVGSWPNQSNMDVNVIANGMMQLAHLFASSEYLKERLKQKRILTVMGYIPLDKPEVYLFKLSNSLLTMYETIAMQDS